MSTAEEPGARVLLTVSGAIPRDIAVQVTNGACPRPDYLALAEAMDADVLDVAAARRQSGAIGRVLSWLGSPGPLLAWACFRLRDRYDTIVTDGEHVGLLLALLSRMSRRQWRHVMIAHILSVRKKTLLIKIFRLRQAIDRVVVYSSWQQEFIVSKLGFVPEDVVLIPFMVDTTFFDPDRIPGRASRMICAAGLERRDYPTLLEAVRGLDVRVVVAAASPWSRRADTTRRRQLPANVDVCSLGFVELRDLYAEALFVVMPLYDVEFQAGVTTILEAMAMRKAVICSRTRGQTDVIEDGTTGLYVQPGDPGALRAAITRLLADPLLAERLGRAARHDVECKSDVHVYAERFAALVGAAAEGPPS